MRALYREYPPGNEIAILLLEHGADPDLQSDSRNPVAFLHSTTPISKVISQFDEAISANVLTLMLKMGVDLNPRSALGYESSPLITEVAPSGAGSEAIAILLDRRARLGVGNEDDS